MGGDKGEGEYLLPGDKFQVAGEKITIHNFLPLLWGRIKVGMKNIFFPPDKVGI